MNPSMNSPNGAKKPMQGKQKSPVRDWLVFAGILAVATVLLIGFPAQRQPSINAFRQFLSEMIFVMPAVLVMMGLFGVWVPKEVINSYLGHGSGLLGMVIALLFGTLPTGPLYAAFPLSKGLLDKGASPANVFIFLAAWACIKIPQELVELQFLGWRFTLARFGFTVIVVFALAVVFQWILGKNAKDVQADV
jgi:uncharacterized membrane protein YraQ (UPF0718 family)